jgi:hypothetical protein
LGADVFGQTRWGANSAWFSYSYATFRENAAGERSGLKGISRHNVRLGATFAVTPKLLLTPSLVLRSTPENLAVGQLDRETKTPYEVNLNAVFQTSRSTELFVNLRNVTDRRAAVGGIAGQAAPVEPFRGTVGFRSAF